ncbi:hypothetical protein JCM16303_001800 [Sporobolomyces ruberrimus]
MPRSSTLVFFSTLVSLALAADPTISSPNVYQCTPTTSYQVTCDAPPCQVIARPSDDPTQSLAVIGSIDSAGASTISWRASVPAGTSITVYITDANGAFNNNSPTTVAEGTGDCGGSDNSSSAAAGSSSAPNSSSSTASESSASRSASESSSSSQSSESSSSSSAASSSSSTSATRSTVTTTSQTTTASGTSSAPTSTPTDAGSGASSIAVGGLFAGVLAVAAALA